MVDDFLPPTPLKDRSNMWRNIISIVVLLFATGSFGVYYFVQDDVRLSNVSHFIDTVSLPSDLSAQAGGDIVFAPPVEIELPKLPKLVGELLSSDNFSAEAIIVKDKETGIVLYGKNEYKLHSVASITKLMSARVFLEKEIDWEKIVEVTSQDVVDTHMYAGDMYSIDELWKAALIGSSNKAILTLANALGWPQVAFVERMNQKAEELGMTDTKFREPTGLDAGDVSTASDLAILLDDVLDSQKIKETLLEKELDLYSNERKKAHHLWSTNWLLLDWIPNEIVDFRGGKTGYIPAAGYNFTMQVADEYGHVINVVILGASSHEARFTEARDVAEHVFEVYEWPDEVDDK